MEERMAGVVEEREEEEEVAPAALVDITANISVSSLQQGCYTVEDDEKQNVGFFELLALNKPDWPLVVIGVLMSAIIGTLYPLSAVLFSEILQVSVLRLTHLAHFSSTFPDLWAF